MIIGWMGLFSPGLSCLIAGNLRNSPFLAESQILLFLGDMGKFAKMDQDPALQKSF